MEKKEVKPAVAKTSPETINAFDIQEISELLKAFTKSNVNELKLEKGEYKITIRQGITSAAPAATAAPVFTQSAPVASTPAPAPAPVAAAPAPAAAPTANTTIIKSPMIGTFYRSSGPDKAPFVNVDDDISKGQAICIIEAMKLFNEIEAEIKGKIVKVLVDDATPVEYDQPLFEVSLD
jgi:acetyl-CoA carboxylase biotin carboxyl carrier protein